MTKICPQCDGKIEMKKINHVIHLKSGGLIPQIQYGAMYINDDRDLDVYYYVCPKCGLVQQYLLDDKMKYLENL